MTSAELANHLQALECKYASFTNKLSLALQYGSSNLECLQNTAFIVKSNLEILRKFYSDGKICSDACNLVNGTWLLTHLCGYIVAPYTSYICYYSFVDSGLQRVPNSIWDFNEDLSLTLTMQDGTVYTGTYTYDSSTGIVVLAGFSAIGLVTVTFTFSDNCLSIEGVYNNPANSQTVLPYYTNIGGNNNSCDWAEYCITEEEAEDLIKICYKKLSSPCNC